MRVDWRVQTVQMVQSGPEARAFEHLPNMIFSRLLVIFLPALAFTFIGPVLAADKLRIGYGAPSVAMSVLWITKEAKLFEKNGLEVEVLYLESALVQRALIAGNIDYGEMTGSLMAAPKLQGA